MPNQPHLSIPSGSENISIIPRLGIAVHDLVDAVKSHVYLPIEK
jgi:hypothetical protein